MLPLPVFFGLVILFLSGVGILHRESKDFLFKRFKSFGSALSGHILPCLSGGE